MVWFFEEQRAPSRKTLPSVSFEGNHLLEIVSLEEKNHSTMTKAKRICSEKFPKCRPLGPVIQSCGIGTKLRGSSDDANT